MFIKDTNCVYLWCNENYAKDLKIKPKDIVGKTDIEFYPKKLSAKYCRDDQSVMKSGKTKDIEEEYIVDGKSSWVHTIKAPYKNEKGKTIGVIGIFWDMTERKKLDKELMDLTNRLNLAKESADIGVWDWDVKNNVLLWDDKMYKIFKVNKKDFKGAYEAWAATVHPDDLKKAGKKVQDALLGKSEFNTSFRIIWPNGEIRHIKGHAHVTRNAKGKALKMTGVNWDITNSKEAEEKLQKSEEKYRLLFESSRDSIMTLIPGGRFLSGNQATLKMFGFLKEKDFTNQEPADLSPKHQPDGELSSKKAKRMMDLAMKNGSHFFEWTHKRKNGQEFFATVLLTKTTLGPEKILQATVRDITTRKENERKIVENEEKFRSLFEQSNDAVFVHGFDGEIFDVNERACQMLGYSRKELLKLKISDLHIEDDLEIAQRAFKETIEQGHTRVEVQFKKANGEIIYVDVSARVIDQDKGVIERSARLKKNKGVIQGIARDITQEKQAQRAKDEFVSFVSHQLKGPISDVALGSEFLLMESVGKLSQDQAEYLKEMHTKSKNMIDLINMFLNVSKIEMGQLDIKPEPVLLSAFVNGTLESMSNQINNRKINVTTKFSGDIPKIKLDRNLLQIVVQNLLTNAIKYSDMDGDISIQLKKKKTGVQLSISDHGAGISKKDQKAVFNRMFRGEAGSKNIEGSGLGLYITQKIVTGMKGEIWLDSTKGKGTTFHVHFPLDGMKVKDMREALLK